MAENYFLAEDNLWEITEKYPETIDVLVSRGFKQIRDSSKREKFGKAVTLKQAAKLRNINLTRLEDLLISEIEQKRKQVDSTMKENKLSEDVNVEGLLPCPVRVPLLEALNQKIDELNFDVGLDLRAASSGVDWLKDKLAVGPDAEELSDIFISAGFDLFFDRKLIDKYRRQGVFKDSSGLNKLNYDFRKDNINLLDPAGDYAVLGVVPAVFLVNKEELGEREVPRSWQDLFKDDFKNSISLPVSDFDLFNAILLNIYKKYGKNGVTALGKNLQKSLHPAQMVKGGGQKKSGEPAVTIMPYFFTRMAKRFTHMEFVWPEDGAIISPIFMLIKEASLPQIQPLVDFFSSAQVGKILAEQGLFPSVHPEVDNNLPENSKFMWPGWDFLREKDPGELLLEMENIFEQAVKGRD